MEISLIEMAIVLCGAVVALALLIGMEQAKINARRRAARAAKGDK